VLHGDETRHLTPELVQRVGEQNVRSDGVVVPLETRLIPVA